jgi:predicted GIY-YIG superfamily endonuclease
MANTIRKTIIPGKNFYTDTALTAYIDSYSNDPWPGAYIITHLATGSFYIGSTGSLHARKNTHEHTLRRGVHDSRRLQELFNQSPFMHFSYWIAADKEQALDWEQFLINLHWGNPLLLNCSTCAEFPATGTTYSDERRAAMLDYYQSPEGMTKRKKLAEVSAARSRKVSIEGIIYNSVSEAVQKLGLTENCVRERLQTRKNRADLWPAWFFIKNTDT